MKLFNKTSHPDIFAAIEDADRKKFQEIIHSNPSLLRLIDKDGRAPLHVAACKGQTEIVMLLLSAGADLHAQDLSGATPLHWAAVGGHRQVIEKLLAAGADINAVDKHDITPDRLAEMRGHTEIAVFLRRYGGRR
jgi:ankyrin repeat protein